MILAGRGFGKTRTGAETVRHWVRTNKYVNLIGATADDARDIMVEGESGILAVCPNDERPLYKKSERQLRWPNGAISLIFTADEPERLRGKQHMKLWGDEYAAWRYKEAWDQASLGLRLGVSPQALLTTTPKPTKELRALMAAPSTFVTRGPAAWKPFHAVQRVRLARLPLQSHTARKTRSVLPGELYSEGKKQYQVRSQARPASDSKAVEELRTHEVAL